MNSFENGKSDTKVSHTNWNMLHICCTICYFCSPFFPTQKYRVSGWMRRRRGMLFGTRVWVRWHFSGTHTAFFFRLVQCCEFNPKLCTEIHNMLNTININNFTTYTTIYTEYGNDIIISSIISTCHQAMCSNDPSTPRWNEPWNSKLSRYYSIAVSAH